MEAGTIIYLVIISMCALVMIGIGIVQLKSKRPVGFWSGVKPPDAKRVKDVEAYITITLRKLISKKNLPIERDFREGKDVP